jgi:sugar lactone lactonase YvrE
MKKTHNTSKNWEVVLNHRCMLGEGPVWDAANETIFWVDIMNGAIHQFSHVHNQHRVMNVGQEVGAIALKRSGGLVAALKNGFAKVDLTTGTVQLLTDPERHLPDNRFNDGKCDPAGNFWAGTMDQVHSEQGAGSLYVLNRDLSISVKLQDVTCSNGIAWSIDQTTFYYIDTPTRQVMAYDYDPGSSAITNGRVIITIPAEDGLPDGMTIDAEGMLWIAHWDGWKVSRWNPLRGSLIQSLTLPASRITSCTFGGKHLEDLYITSAQSGLTEAELLEQPLAGSLFVVKNCGSKGLLPFQFEG